MCDPQMDPRRVGPTVAGDVIMFAASTSKDSSDRTDEMQSRLVCCLSPEYAGLGCGDSAGGNWSIWLKLIDSMRVSGSRVVD